MIATIFGAPVRLALDGVMTRNVTRRTLPGVLHQLQRKQYSAVVLHAHCGDIEIKAHKVMRVTVDRNTPITWR